MSKEREMNLFKSVAWGFVLGSIVTIVVGFAWGGWFTGSGADRLAAERSSASVVAALLPVCLEKAKADPASVTKLAALKALTSSWDQRDAVIRDGWATVGAGEANREVADACASRLADVAAR
jgi:hypothetical protein